MEQTIGGLALSSLETMVSGLMPWLALLASIAIGMAGFTALVLAASGLARVLRSGRVTEGSAAAPARVSHSATTTADTGSLAVGRRLALLPLDSLPGAATFGLFAAGRMPPDGSPGG